MIAPLTEQTIDIDAKLHHTSITLNRPCDYNQYSLIHPNKIWQSQQDKMLP